MTNSIVDPPPVTARLLERTDLDDDQSSAMYRLLSSHFDGVTQAQFLSDLQQKNWIILIERDHLIVGFSTLCAYETTAYGEVCSVIYSGDTIVSPDASNSSTLPRIWIESVATLRKSYPRGRFLWLLITSGFRTYRFLPVFWREFYPRYDRPTPPAWQQMLCQLAARRFASRFDPSSGIVKFDNPQMLKPGLAGIPLGRLHDPHIEFFAARNPNHPSGDELVCLCELSSSNLTSAGRRMASNITSW